MRPAIFVLSAAAFVFGCTAGSAMAAPAPAQTHAAGGLAWCGFKDKPGSRVRCGYSSESGCKQAIGDPGAICIVDPYLTENRQNGARRG